MSRSRAALHLLCVLTLAASAAPAAAQAGEPRPSAASASDDELADEGAEPGASGIDPAGAELPAAGTLPPPGQAAPEADGGEPLFGLFERLPPSAYPEPRVRGLRGGSLWSTFHGLQWPSYRRTGIGVSGYAWIDTGYERIERGNPTDKSIKYLLQQGRLLLRVTPTFSTGRWFVQGQAELVANKDQSSRQPDIADADDVWLRVGMWDVFDVQLGRFEGWEVYHFGMGMDLNTLERLGATDGVYAVPEVYGVTYAYYRPPGVGQAAVHVYVTDFFRFELGAQLGNEFGSNTLAGRPVGVLDLGWLKLKVGAEYKALNDQKDGAQGETIKRGVGAALQLVFDPIVELGVNGGYALGDRTAPDGATDEKGSYTTYSLGAFANVRLAEDLLLGGGINLTKLHDLHYDMTIGDNGRFDHLQTFVALQYVVLGHLYLKVVGAYAKANFRPTFGEPIFDNDMLSVRLRAQFLF